MAVTKKILMIAYYYPPVSGGGVQRTSKFAKYLPLFGYAPVFADLIGDNLPFLQFACNNLRIHFQYLCYLGGREEFQCFRHEVIYPF